jgi:hypothetical protein
VSRIQIIVSPGDQVVSSQIDKIREQDGLVSHDRLTVCINEDLKHAWGFNLADRNWSICEIEISEGTGLMRIKMKVNTPAP